MSYQVLARKWRPKTFADLVGQEHVVRALSNALTASRLHHAYLLTGTRGVGKTTIARILAKSLNCENGVSAEPCGKCSACTQIDSGRFVDLLEIDAASNTGIDNIREVLENAQYAPSAGRFKVYIIDEVHMLSKSAFNAMLKTLEEPPAHVKFILATTDPQKVPVTVLSRCLQFSLRNMTAQQIASHLAHVLNSEQIIYQPAALSLLARAAAGSMRDALSLLDQSIAYGVGQVEESGVRAMLGSADKRLLLILLDCLSSGDGEALVREAEIMANNGIGFDTALTELAVLLQQIALEQTVADSIAEDEPERESLIALAAAFNPEDIQLYYQIALHGRKDLSLAPDEHAGFLMTLLRMLAFRPQEANSEHPLAKKPQVEHGHQADAARKLLDNAQHSPQIKNNIVAVAEIAQTAQTAPAKNLAPQIDQVVINEQTDVASAEMLEQIKAIPRLSDSDWQKLVQQLAPQLAAAQMLANNAILHKQTGNCWSLLLAPSFKQLITRSSVEKLRNVLSTHFGQELRIDIELSAHDSQTPQMERTRIKQDQLNQARSELEKDPNAQALQQEFGAVLLPETIQPLEE